METQFWKCFSLYNFQVNWFGGVEGCLLIFAFWWKLIFWDQYIHSIWKKRKNNVKSCFLKMIEIGEYISEVSYIRKNCKYQHSVVECVLCHLFYMAFRKHQFFWLSWFLAGLFFFSKINDYFFRFLKRLVYIFFRVRKMSIFCVKIDLNAVFSVPKIANYIPKWIINSLFDFYFPVSVSNCGNQKLSQFTGKIWIQTTALEPHSLILNILWKMIEALWEMKKRRWHSM